MKEKLYFTLVALVSGLSLWLDYAFDPEKVSVGLNIEPGNVLGGVALFGFIIVSVSWFVILAFSTLFEKAQKLMKRRFPEAYRRLEGRF
jgi:hypothetical protein